MGKAEAGTPKDIANRMKAKGLQKLKWYCQMCQKQCRDENGFKCHTTSESHQQQLLLFADNPDKYLDSFSEEFYEGFVSLLKRQCGTKRVHANNVYQDYIHDRHHVHMNSTQWESLTDFVKWLGREGHCTVDETEKGWYVAYIDREPETLLREKLKRKREKTEKDDEERFQEFINKQIEVGKSKRKDDEKFSDLQRNDEEAIKLDIKLNSKVKSSTSKVATDNPLSSKSNSVPHKSKKEPSTKKRSTLEEIIEEDMKRKERFKKSDDQDKVEIPADVPWLTKNIYVKVITKELGSKYYKSKGVIIDVVNEYLAIVKLNECGTKLKLDQIHLETVVPNIERDVLILKGKYKGFTAKLLSLEVEEFSAKLGINDKPYRDKIVRVPYEDFSKLKIES